MNSQDRLTELVAELRRAVIEAELKRGQAVRYKARPRGRAPGTGLRPPL